MNFCVTDLIFRNANEAVELFREKQIQQMKRYNILFWPYVHAEDDTHIDF